MCHIRNMRGDQEMKTGNVLAVGSLIVVVFASGCASTPKYPNTIAAGTVHTIRIQENIYTPHALNVPSPDIGQSSMLSASHGLAIGGAAAGIGGAVQNAKINQFTAAVRKDIDFQQFAADTLRNCFLNAVSKHTQWTVSSTPDQPADATVSLGIQQMGTRGPFGIFPFIPILNPPKYAPTVIVNVTMTGHSSPAVGMAEKNAVDEEVIMYQRIECNDRRKLSKEAYTLAPASGFSGLPKYSGDVELFKRAFTEAIEQAVNQLAESWQ